MFHLKGRRNRTSVDKVPVHKRSVHQIHNCNLRREELIFEAFSERRALLRHVLSFHYEKWLAVTPVTLQSKMNERNRLQIIFGST
jgi:hypothetical protein